MSPEIPDLLPLGQSILYQRRAASKEFLLESLEENDYDELTQYSPHTSESQESFNNMIQIKPEVISRKVMEKNRGTR